jgi:sugar phosphate isomerase/epimerase
MQNPIAVSTWSLHQLLGISHQNGPGDSAPYVREATWGEGSLTLEDLPAALAERGYDRCEICHFHLASQDKSYLHALRGRFRDAGVAVQTLLIDDGDFTNPDTRQRDLAWIESWIDAAEMLGAGHARVIAGKARPSESSFALSIDGLGQVARRGKSRGVRVVTENWFDLTASPRDVFHLLDGVGGELGLLADMGNWGGPDKYANLEAIFARAELCHAKTDFHGGVIDASDFRQCLTAAKTAGYKGPFTLVFESDGEEWGGLAAERDAVDAVVGRA